MRARNWADIFYLWLALATVLVPALGSSGSPLRLTEGSAFSAFTSDVSLGPSRAASIEEEDDVRTPPADGADNSTLHAGAAFAAPMSARAIARPAPGRAFIDPPSPRPARIAAGPIGPRAPPRA